jgi:hypothetical protein
MQLAANAFAKFLIAGLALDDSLANRMLDTRLNLLKPSASSKLESKNANLETGTSLSQGGDDL